MSWQASRANEALRRYNEMAAAFNLDVEAVKLQAGALAQQPEFQPIVQAMVRELALRSPTLPRHYPGGTRALLAWVGDQVSPRLTADQRAMLPAVVSFVQGVGDFVDRAGPLTKARLDAEHQLREVTVSALRQRDVLVGIDASLAA